MVLDLSYNPLARAAEKGLTEAIKCLLEAGANPNVPDTVRFASCYMHHYSDLLDFISSIA
jgi:ankyrin repeat protein